MLSPEDKLLVDRYLDNTLTGIELRDFLARLENDEQFKNEVSFHNKLIEGIGEAEDHRLREFVVDAIGYKKPLIPMSLKMIVTFLILTFGGIVYWEYIGPGSTSERKNFFTFNFSKKPEQAVNETEKKQRAKIIAPVTEQVAEKADADSSPLNDTVKTDDIFVKKDQMLISYQLQSIELGQDQETNQALANKDASVGTPEKKTRKYDVEFWVSPVNYEGYKLQGDKLILFGIDAPDQVQLYSVNENLWLKYGNDFFRIETNDNFESLTASNNVPSELK